MKLKSLHVQNFRNLNKRFEFSNNVNLVIGDNGLGKTNLLEAISFFSSGKSFRTSKEISCVNIGGKDYTQGTMRLSGKFENSLGNSLNLEVIIEKIETSRGNIRSKKILKINKNKVRRSKFVGNFFGIAFSPDTVDLVRGTPSVRRNELDDYLSILNLEYFDFITEYKKVVRNRNKLLDDWFEGKSDTQQLKFWTAKLIELGAKIIYIRDNFLNSVNPLIQELALDVYNNDKINLLVKYESKFNSGRTQKEIRKVFKEKIVANIEKEKRAGLTLYGPHREDFSFILNGNDLREFGSRGQQRLGALLFKLAQWEFLYRKKGFTPILLLDDIFSELDNTVIKKVQRLILDWDSQIILTALKAEEFSDEFTKESKKIILK